MVCGGGALTGDFDSKVIFYFVRKPSFFLGGGLQAMCERMLWKWASLSIGGPGGEVCLPGTLRDSKRVLDKWGL